jgi:2-polyprenyl-3-methyl-5-hydroxy-6-metoxy-1,4-benzoquinol methylase
LLLGLIADTYPQASGIGFDSSGSAIAAAQTMAANNGLQDRIQFEHRAVGDAWPAGPFDVVSLVDVLHHIPPEHQRAVVEQSFAHVRPGGVLIYKDMGQRPLISALWNRAHDLILARQWIHYRAIAEVKGWLETDNAEIIKTDARSMGPYAHELIVARRPDTVTT